MTEHALKASIAARNTTFAYEERQPVLRRLCFEVASDQVISILGPSGVGKSTLLKLLAGVHCPGDTGVAQFKGDLTINGHQPSFLRGPSAVNMMFQSPSLLAHLTVRRNILLPTQLTQAASNDSDERVNFLLHALGLSNAENIKPRALSGGMRTRVALARALVCKPTFLFLDEPFTGVDITTRWRLYQLLHAERRDPGKVTLIATHDVFEALLLADILLFLHQSTAATTISILEHRPPNLSELSLKNAIEAVQPQVWSALEHMGAKV